MLLTLAGLDVDAALEGELPWYALEGNVGGTAGEQVVVTGQSLHRQVYGL